MRHLARIFVALIAALLMADTVIGDGQYTVIAPGSVHSESDYDVALAVHHTKEPCKIEVGITGPSYNKTEIVELATPDDLKIVKFRLPKLKEGNYNLTAKGLSGLVFENTTKLQNNDELTPYVQIQTDKGKYKPGDVVNFRVIFLDKNLLPAVPEEDTVIFLEDKKRNRIREIKNFKTRNGVYTGKFELSEYALLGSWTINVRKNKLYPHSRVYFDVERYVLPKYTVKVEATENVAVQDGDIQIRVRANYTYGKPVNGKVLILLELDGTTIYTYVDGKSISETKPSHSTICSVDMVNGKAKCDLNLKEYADYLPYKTSPAYIRITATVEEEFTGVKINETAGTLLYPYRYHMNCHDFEHCYQFHADKEEPVSFKLTYIDGTELKDTKSVVRVIYTEGIRKNWHYRIDENKETNPPKIENMTFTFESHMNESGIATFNVKLPDLPDIENYTRYFQVELEYAGEKREVQTIYPYREPKKSNFPAEETPKDYFNIEVQQKPNQYFFKIGDEVTLTLNSSKTFKYFVYNIIGRANVQRSERIDLEKPQNIYNLTVKTDFSMAPNGRIYAYYVDEDGDFKFAESSFNVEVELRNQINITAPAEVKPGTDVTLEIKTAPHSFVGLRAVDQSVLLLGSNNDINFNDFKWRLGLFDTHTPWQGGYSYFPGERTGVVTLTNANFFYNLTAPDHRYVALEAGGVLKSKIAFSTTQSDMAGGNGGFSSQAAAGAMAPSSANVAVRKNFAETWIFADIEDTQSEVFKWTKPIPDTITSWVLNAFAIHPEKGLAVLADETRIKTFQSFFISIRLPYSIKRGETIKVPALVFNYLNKDLDVEVTLDNTDDEYDFVDESNDVNNEPKRVKVVRVGANDAAGVSFTLRPKIVGKIMLKFVAISPIAADAIHKTLRVLPEGVTQYANRAFLVNLKHISEAKESFELELPADIVPNSQHAEFSVIGDLLGPVLKNIDNLLYLPNGCGEQTMSKLVPNILVYDYLEKIGKLTPVIQSRIKRNLEQGYMNMLNYRHDDGSFSSFGPSKLHTEEHPRNGSTWLTAYVLRWLPVISKHVDVVDDKLLNEGYQYLYSKQAENGSFVENGEYFYGAQRSHLTLTASCLLALQAQKEPSKVHIDKAIEYLNANIENTKELLPKAIATYALQKSQDTQAEKHLASLNALTKTEEDRQWWTESEEVKSGPYCRRWWCFVFSNDVEITSYMMLSLLQKESVESLLPILNWLIAQRNNYGGFSSSQDTVVGLQAIIELAKKAEYEPAVLDVDVNSHGGKEKSETINVTEDNGLLLQSIELPEGTKSVDFHAKGKGTALVQISYQYNIVEKEPKPSFQIEAVLRPDVPPAKLELDVCVQYIEEKSEASNMAILEVSLPSGYTADETSFEQIQEVERVRLIETKNDDTVIVIYFEKLPKNERKCIPIIGYKTFEVSNQKPAPIMLYDYYDTNKKATEYYQI